jgi:RNA polymerase sigma-70 factor (ECF subfamily)
MNGADPVGDEQLIQSVMQGDRDALATLVARHHRPLLGYLYRLLGGNRLLAEDLVQETFMRVLQQENYEPGRPFKPWLYAIATNLARDHFRSANARHTFSSDDAELQDLFDPAPGPEERAVMSEQGRAVSAALAQLGEEYRIALILRFYNGLSLQEIAETLNVPLGTVKSRLSVGTQRLRQRLVSSKEEVIR